MDSILRERATALLRKSLGNSNASFRAGQLEAIEHVLDHNGPLLIVQRTGWGKSIVYFIAAKLLREQNAGPTLIVSPLLALIRNEIAAAERMGICQPALLPKQKIVSNGILSAPNSMTTKWMPC